VIAVQGAIDDTEGIIVIVTEADVSDLVNILKGGLERRIAFDGPPREYLGRVLDGVVVTVTDDALVRVCLKDGDIVIMGSRVALGRLAAELQLFVESDDLNDPGMHTHFDPGQSMAMSRRDILVAEDSMPLMVAGPVY
jgi:hypothetical protein